MSNGFVNGGSVDDAKSSDKEERLIAFGKALSTKSDREACLGRVSAGEGDPVKRLVEHIFQKVKTTRRFWFLVQFREVKRVNNLECRSTKPMNIEEGGFVSGEVEIHGVRRREGSDLRRRKLSDYMVKYRL